MSLSPFEARRGMIIVHQQPDFARYPKIAERVRYQKITECSA